MRQQTSAEGKERPFYETATPEEWAKAFREWAESHPHNQPQLPMKRLAEKVFMEKGANVIFD